MRPKVKYIRNILILEDDPAICEVLNLALKNKYLNIICANDGKIFWDHLANHTPDLFILDLWVPGFEWKKHIAQIQKSRKTKNIPIIIMSAQKPSPAFLQSFKVEKYINKPFDLLEIESAIKELLRF